ncbi:FAD-dependent oxidoreductase [Streptomyces sp. NPDC001795]|uniref:FAD-dependent oxidoreductase n=1 Tax=unclassified Streptomyces TaxID=2593676 RepID=UPI003331C17C
MPGAKQQGKLIVIGAGVAGLSAALAAARIGFDVVCLEARVVGAEAASSAGWMKIFRYAYDDARYSRLMIETDARWRGLERSFGRPLIRSCPSLNFGSQESPKIQNALRSLQATQRKHVLLQPGDEQEAAMGGFLYEGEVGVVELGAGVMDPATVLMALREAVEDSGVVLRERTPVLRLSSGTTTGVRVDTATERLHADRAIVAAGPWTPRLLPDSADRLTVTRQVQTLFTTSRPIGDGRLFSWAEVPEDTFYGVCNLSNGCHVIGTHAPASPIAADAPRDPHAEEKAVRAQLDFLAQRLAPDIQITPVRHRVCHYTNTTDESFLVERHQPGIVLLSACSGHGFKFGITTGHQAAQIAASLI